MEKPFLLGGKTFFKGQVKAERPGEEFELRNIWKKLPKHQASGLQEGLDQMELIVALHLSQHVKHLSEISDVLECNCKTIFTPAQLAARRFLLPSRHSYGAVAQARRST